MDHVRAAGGLLVSRKSDSCQLYRSALFAEHRAQNHCVARRSRELRVGTAACASGQYRRQDGTGSLCKRWGMEPVHNYGAGRHIHNGQLMAVLVDDDPASSNNADGLIGLQIEGVPSKVSFRNIWLKKIN